MGTTRDMAMGMSIAMAMATGMARPMPMVMARDVVMAGLRSWDMYMTGELMQQPRPNMQTQVNAPMPEFVGLKPEIIPAQMVEEHFQRAWRVQVRHVAASACSAC